MSETAFEQRLRARGLLEPVRRIAREHHVTVLDLYVGRAPRVVRARAAVYELLLGLRWSQVEIGALFERCSTTVSKALRRARRAAA